MSTVEGKRVVFASSNFGGAANSRSLRWAFSVRRYGIAHLVASEDNIFKSKVLDTEDRFSYTFTKPGTYLYYCSVHPKMTGQIVVQ